jgi:hypothetical protein
MAEAFSRLSSEIEHLQEISGQLTSRLDPVVTPSVQVPVPTAKPPQQSCPLGDGLFEMAGRIRSTRECLQDVLNRLQL